MKHAEFDHWQSKRAKRAAAMMPSTARVVSVFGGLGPLLGWFFFMACVGAMNWWRSGESVWELINGVFLVGVLGIGLGFWLAYLFGLIPALFAGCLIAIMPRHPSFTDRSVIPLLVSGLTGAGVGAALGVFTFVPLAPATFAGGMSAATLTKLLIRAERRPAHFAKP